MNWWQRWGGDTIMVSRLRQAADGIENLLEMICWWRNEGTKGQQPGGQGYCDQAQLDKGRGPVATVLVQNGTLKLSDNIVIGSVFGKVGP